MLIDAYHLDSKFAKLISLSTKIKDEELAFSDAVELIEGFTSKSKIRIHIKDKTVYLFNHTDNRLMKIAQLDRLFARPHPWYVDSMFYYADHLNLLSGKHIYSYRYDCKSERFKFKSLNFKFKLPPFIEASLNFKGKILFFKENRLYALEQINQELKNQTIFSSPIEKLLINCSQNERQFKKKFKKHRSLKELVVSFYQNDNDKPSNQVRIGTLILIALGITLIIILLVALFIVIEFFSFSQNSYFSLISIKRKSFGIVIKPSPKSPSTKEFSKLLEKNKILCLNTLETEDSISTRSDRIVKSKKFKNDNFNRSPLKNKSNFLINLQKEGELKKQ